MTVSAKQNWTNAGTGASVASQALAYASIPVAGNLLVCFAERGGGDSHAITIADDMTDGGTWTEITHGVLSGGDSEFGWWKIVGASANSNKTITCSHSPNAALTVFAAEYQSSVGGITWQLNGTATVLASSGANPSPGNITVDATPSVAIGYIAHATTTATAGTGYTRQTTSAAWNFDAVEDKFLASSGTETTPWTVVAGNSLTIGVVFEASTAAAATGWMPWWYAGGNG